MSELRLELAAGETTFAPGESLRGTASWRLHEPPEALEVRLFWYTEGKGERDVEVVDTVPINSSSREGSREFTLRAPTSPLSFSGKLISLIWAIELVRLPGGDAARQEIIVGHGGREIRIGSREDAPDNDVPDSKKHGWT